MFRVLKDKKRWNEGPSNGDPLSRGGHGHQSISSIDHQKYVYFYTLVKSRIFDMIKAFREIIYYIRMKKKFTF